MGKFWPQLEAWYEIEAGRPEELTSGKYRGLVMPEEVPPRGLEGLAWLRVRSASWIEPKA